jgi:hypothetical protein
MVEPKRLTDWRIGVSGEVAEAAGHFKAGEIVYFLTEIATPNYGTVQVPVPSPVRLGLSLAVKAARAAHQRLSHADGLSKPGRKLVADDPASLGFMYDLIEECMLAAIFSHLALEAHANDLIHRLLGDRELELTRRTGTISLGSEAIQRQVSTEEKFATVLPAVMGIAIDKGTKVWRDFKILQNVRDAVTHFKSGDHALRGGKVDRETVFYRIFNTRPILYPRAALRMISHFKEYNTHELVEHVESLMASGGDT